MQREVGTNRNVRRVPAVQVPAGEGRLLAQVLATRSAMHARAVGTSEPRDADPIARSKTGHASPDRLDAPHHLMTRHNGQRAGWDVPFHELQVGSTDSAGHHARDEHARRGHRSWKLDMTQRSPSPRSLDVRGASRASKSNAPQNGTTGVTTPPGVPPRISLRILPQQKSGKSGYPDKENPMANGFAHIELTTGDLGKAKKF